MCNSISCKWNKNLRCTRKDIAIYDNTILGLCLSHTGSMKERVLDAFEKGRAVGKKDGEIELLTKLTADQKLLKDPEAFDKWIKRQLGRK